MRSPQIIVAIDLDRVRANLAAIRRLVGREVWAVVKADAYGLGAARVVAAIGGLVDGFCVFSLAEAAAAGIWRRARKPTIVLGPPALALAGYRREHARPAVTTVAQAAALRRARPIACVDTGMQRFACPPAEVAAVIAAGGCDEAFTHATRLEHVRRLQAVAAAVGGGLRLHAAASSLLAEPRARLDAVRPGLALYCGAVRATARLVECRDSRGPVGYGGFRARRHGVIMAGYAHGLRPGPCLINGRRQRVLEVGMQTAFVSIGAGDRIGDEVVLLGEGLDLDDVAKAWATSPHEVLVRFAGMGRRRYRDGSSPGSGRIPSGRLRAPEVRKSEAGRQRQSDG